MRKVLLFVGLFWLFGACKTSVPASLSPSTSPSLAKAMKTSSGKVRKGLGMLFSEKFEGNYHGKVKIQGTMKNLAIHVTSIWKERTDGSWFYTETSLSNLPEEPLWQEVVLVKECALDSVVMEFYQFSEERHKRGFLMLWLKRAKDINTKALEISLSPKMMVKNESCFRNLIKSNTSNSFEASTKAKSCLASSLGIKDSKFVETTLCLNVDTLTTKTTRFSETGLFVSGGTVSKYVRIPKSDLLNFYSKFIK
jgi:hypothetical protein